MAMAPVILVVDMDVVYRREEEKIKKDLMNIAGVVEVFVSWVTGHVAIVGMADPATLGEVLASTLRRPVFLVADFGAAAPAPPVAVGGGYGAKPPTSPAAPSSPFPAPTVAGGYQPYGYRAMPPPSPAPSYYNPYVRHNQLSYATPTPPEAGYYYTPFGGRPWGPLYTRNDVAFEDEDHNGCCCSIQ